MTPLCLRCTVSHCHLRRRCGTQVPSRALLPIRKAHLAHSLPCHQDLQHNQKLRCTSLRHVKATHPRHRVRATGLDAQQPQPVGQSEVAKLSAVLTNYFPVWVAIACVVAVAYPPSFLWFRKEYVTSGLALTMLAMGTTLSLEVSHTASRGSSAFRNNRVQDIFDFSNVVKEPGRVVLGAVLQYTIMPLMGLLVSKLANLPTPFAIGICLVASCPGGTASNVVTFLANADVALSVMMTTVSTLAAIVMTPLLTKALVGALVPVDAKALFMSTVQVVLAPVILGAALNQTFPKAIKQTAPFAPLVAVAAVVLIVASVIAQNAVAVTLAGPKLIAAIIALHSGGFALGYGISRAAGLPEKAARTNSIEVGMQNSALGAVLAGVHFSDARIAVPCALSACIHSLMGSILAAAWRASDKPAVVGSTS